MSSNYLLKKGLLLSYEEELSLAAMHRLIKKSGAGRVSDSACRELSKVLEELVKKIGVEALEYIMYAGRKTLKGKDVKISAKKVLNP